MDFLKGCAMGLALLLAATLLALGLEVLKAAFGPIGVMAALAIGSMLFFGFLNARHPL